MKDETLIELIKEDPDKGIAVTVELYGGAVKAICSNILRGYNSDDIDEAWSNTFFNLWKNIDKFDLEKKTSLKTFICSIARNSSLHTRRDVNRNQGRNMGESMIDGLIDIQTNIEDEVLLKQTNELILDIINTMGEPDKSIFILRYYFFESIKSIAMKLEITPKKVENILMRRKNKIRKKLEERGYENEQN